MKIGFNISRINNTYSQNSRTEYKKNSGHPGIDRIEISREGLEISKYVSIARDVEIKNDKVHEIKNKMDRSEYQVDHRELSRSIIDYLKERDR